VTQFSSFQSIFCVARDKAIRDFQAILSKYDGDVGDATRELEELRNALELQRKEFANWKETVCEPQIRLQVSVLYILTNSFIIVVMHSVSFLFFHGNNLASESRRHAKCMHDKAEAEHQEMEQQMMVTLTGRMEFHQIIAPLSFA